MKPGKMGKVMGEFKRGSLHSGPKKGPKVKARRPEPAPRALGNSYKKVGY